jgi:hypothetical protein
LKVVLWGFSSPKCIESVAAELRHAIPHATLSVQIPESARSVEYCGIQPEEFLRVGEGDDAQLRGIVQRMSRREGVLVLDIWSLLLLPNFADFFRGLAGFAEHLKAIVCLAPDAWPGIWREHRVRAISGEAASQEVLFARARQVLEFIFNVSGNFFVVQSPPSLDQVEIFLGRENLPLVRRWGLDWAPRPLLRETAQFCSRNALAKAVVACVEDAVRGGRSGWRWRVDSDVNFSPDRFIKQEASEWSSLTRMMQIPMSWERYCSEWPVSYEHCVAKNCVVKRSAYVAWLYFLAVLENTRGEDGKKIPIESAFQY